jgi:hypothetical protein
MVGEMNGKATSNFRREVDENCALLGYYAASSGNFLPTFRDNLSVPFSSVKDKKVGKELTTTFSVITQKSAVLMNVMDLEGNGCVLIVAVASHLRGSTE